MIHSRKYLKILDNCKLNNHENYFRKEFFQRKTRGAFYEREKNSLSKADESETKLIEIPHAPDLK